MTLDDVTSEYAERVWFGGREIKIVAKARDVEFDSSGQCNDGLAQTEAVVRTKFDRLFDRERWMSQASRTCLFSFLLAKIRKGVVPASSVFYC